MRCRTVRLEDRRRYPMSRNEAWRLLGDQSRGNDVVMLRDVFDQASSRITLDHQNVAAERFNTRLRGFDAEQELIRLSIDRPAPRRIITDRESTGVG